MFLLETHMIYSIKVTKKTQQQIKRLLLPQNSAQIQFKNLVQAFLSVEIHFRGQGTRSSVQSQLTNQWQLSLELLLVAPATRCIEVLLYTVLEVLKNSYWWKITSFSEKVQPNKLQCFRKLHEEYFPEFFWNFQDSRFEERFWNYLLETSFLITVLL